MTEEEKRVLLKRNDEEAEDDYDEEADEDFVLEEPKDKYKSEKRPGRQRKNNDTDDSDFDSDIESEQISKKYSEIESDSGGLIKTRRQRANELSESVKKSTVKATGSNKSDINSIWAELNNLGKTPNNGTSSLPSPELSSPDTKEVILKEEVQVNDKDKNRETITIKRTYEFAGETITEEKLVDINSQEAKAHLNSTTLISKHENETKHKDSLVVPNKLRRKRKRASLLDAVISNSSKAKLSTLEKSRLDWASYVDKNKINDELKYKNKDGYLEKQDFLSRVDNKQDELMRQAKKKK